MDTSKANVPFFLDFATKIPKGIEIERSCQVKDCVTYDGGTARGSDDD